MRILADGNALTKPASGIGRVAAQTALHSAPLGCDIRFAARRPRHNFYENAVPEIDKSRAPAGNWHHSGLRNIIETYQPDLFWGPAHRLPFAMPKTLPTIVTVHDLVWKKHPETMHLRTRAGEHLLFAHAVQRADAIACVSQATANDLLHFFPATKDKIRVVYPGATPAIAHAARQKLSGKPYALFVGTFEPRKNLERVLAAFASLPDALRQNYDFVIAGGKGWGRVDAHALITEMDLEDSVRIISSPDDDHLQQLYAGCEFLIMPSLYEGFGLPIAEALQYGKAVLTSDISSMPEVAQSAGVFIDPFDIYALKHKMAFLFENTKHRNALEKNALQEAQRFSWENSASQMVELFASV